MDRNDIGRGLDGRGMAAALAAAAPAMDALAKRRVRKRVMSALRSEAAVRRTRRVLQRSTAAVVALTLSAGYVPAAAAASLPGDTLYSVKRAIEEARVIAWAGEHRELLLAVSADERARELVELVEAGAPDVRVARASAEFDSAAVRAFGASEHAWEKSLEKAVEGKPGKVEERVFEEAEKVHGKPGKARGGGKVERSGKDQPNGRGSGRP